ncbi:9184_t:CDS:2, partial [Acaulospora colombiana]
SNSANGAAAKRKRLRTKVEVPPPSLPSEESSYGEYAPAMQNMDANAHYYTGQESGIEYSSYDGAHMQHVQPGFGTMSVTPQLSVGPSSNPSSHTTPPFSTVDPNVASGRAAQHPQMAHPNAVSAILEPVAGQHDIFEFSGLDANNLLGQMEIAISLPDDFLVDGLGLGLGEGGFNFDGADSGGGFAEFSNLASFDGLGNSSGDSGVNFGDYSMMDKGLVDPNALSLNEGMPSQHYPPPSLHINTQFTSDPSTIPMSAVSEQFNVTSPSQPSASDGNFY